MLSSVEQTFVGKVERRALLKRPVWEARLYSDLLEMRESPILTKTYFKYSRARIDYQLLFG